MMMRVAATRRPRLIKMDVGTEHQRGGTPARRGSSRSTRRCGLGGDERSSQDIVGVDRGDGHRGAERLDVEVIEDRRRGGKTLNTRRRRRRRRRSHLAVAGLVLGKASRRRHCSAATLFGQEDSGKAEHRLAESGDGWARTQVPCRSSFYFPHARGAILGVP